MITGIISDVFSYKNGVVFVLKNSSSRIRKVFVELPVLARTLGFPFDVLKSRVAALVLLCGKEIKACGLEEEKWYGGQVRNYVKASEIEISFNGLSSFKDLINKETPETTVLKVFKKLGFSKLVKKGIIQKCLQSPSLIFSYVGKRVGTRTFSFPLAVTVYKLLHQLKCSKNSEILLLPVNSALSAVDWYLREVYKEEGRITISLSEVVQELKNFLVYVKDFETFKERVKERFKVVDKKEDHDLVVTSYQHYNTVKYFLKKLCEKAEIEFLEKYVEGLIRDFFPCSVNVDNVVILESVTPETIKEHLSKSDLLVVKGAGGVGKTTLLKGLIDLYRKEGKLCLYVTLTGTKAFEVQEGRTLAHVLKNGISPAYSVILLDEASTVDLYSFYQLLKEVGSRKLVIAGAEDQSSPPVGKEVYNSVIIPLLSQKKGLVLELVKVKRYRKKALCVVPYDKKLSVEKFLIPLIKKINTRGTWLITTPYHDVFPGTKILNPIAKKALGKKPGLSIEKGDRVVVTTRVSSSNGLILPRTALGEVVSEVDDESVIVRLNIEDKVFPELEIKKKYLALAYAIEYYHVQGLETDYVIAIIPDLRTIQRKDFYKKWNVITTRARRGTFLFIRHDLIPYLSVFLDEERLNGTGVKFFSFPKK